MIIDNSVYKIDKYVLFGILRIKSILANVIQGILSLDSRAEYRFDAFTKCTIV